MTDRQTNPPQHVFDQAGSPAQVPQKHRQTGDGTAAPNLDVVDPHPSDEEHPYRAGRPGGTHPPAKDIGPNAAVHDGHAPPRPDNDRDQVPAADDNETLDSTEHADMANSIERKRDA